MRRNLLHPKRPISGALGDHRVYEHAVIFANNLLIRIPGAARKVSAVVSIALSSAGVRLGVDGLNTVRDFLRSPGGADEQIDMVGSMTALHLMPSIAQHRLAMVRLLKPGVKFEVLVVQYSDFNAVDRETVVRACPRVPSFKEDILQTFCF